MSIERPRPGELANVGGLGGIPCSPLGGRALTPSGVRLMAVQWCSTARSCSRIEPPLHRAADEGDQLALIHCPNRPTGLEGEVSTPTHLGPSGVPCDLLRLLAITEERP